MSEWQERITRDTHPAVRVEHETRYRAAAPIVRGAGLWCDLGCGTGVASASALAGVIGEHVLLVDLAEDAAAQAASELGAPHTQTLVADLASEEGLAAVRVALGDAPDGGTITCFETVEHLSSFVGLIELLIEMATERQYTVLLSVPNDAFFAIENPYHQTIWSDGAFEELRRLLPAGHVVARQIPIVGSVIAVGDGHSDGPLTLAPPAAEAVPSHMLVAFGPRAADFAGSAGIDLADLDGQRAWERQREATLAFHEDELVELRDYANEVRDYAHELERRLGERPLKTDEA